MSVDMGRKCVAVLTLYGDIPQSEYHMSVALRALCDDDADNGSSAGDLQLWTEDGEVKARYDSYGREVSAFKEGFSQNGR